MKNKRMFPGVRVGAAGSGFADPDGDMRARVERERGPSDEEYERMRIPPKYQKQLEESRAKIFAEEHFVSPNGTNYHRVPELAEEHLPDLHFMRNHNLFAARTADAYVKTPQKRPVRR